MSSAPTCRHLSLCDTVPPSVNHNHFHANCVRSSQRISMLNHSFSHAHTLTRTLSRFPAFPLARLRTRSTFLKVSSGQAHDSEGNLRFDGRRTLSRPHASLVDGRSFAESDRCV
jgi:hypothetical protein